ncbi:hypothetical protein bcere0024_034260 [Bacillus cereus Rock4-18]|nr:hypothetical protein bcere0024_034260 [Bacillus cereus Rock4-18]
MRCMEFLLSLTKHIVTYCILPEKISDFSAILYSISFIL